MMKARWRNSQDQSETKTKMVMKMEKSEERKTKTNQIALLSIFLHQRGVEWIVISSSK